jgi:cytochrome c oxidase cbb3-type subunit 3
MKPDRPSVPPEPPVRPHTFDGISEYDQRLPNWWLFTLYGAIAFAIAWWMLTQHFRAPTDGERVTADLARIEAAKLASLDTTKLDDEALWKMSRNPAFTEPGKTTFNTLCVSCHLPSMRGKTESPAAIGPDLTDVQWIHGGKPLEVFHLVTVGVPAKGMVTWGPLLGPKKISEVVAYVLSKHDPAEVPVIVPSTTLPAAAPATK